MMGRVPIGELVSISKGKKPSSVVDEPEPGFRRLLQIEDLRPGAVMKYCPPARNEVLAEASDVVLAWDGANAGTCSFGLSGALGSTLAALRPRSGRVVTAYLGHFLRANQQYLRDHCKGATVPHIDGQVLQSLELYLPSPDEQRRIAEVLDRAGALRAKRRAALAELDTLGHAVFLEMFGDPATNPKEFPKATLGEIIDFIGGSQPPRDTFTYEPSADTIRLVQIRDFKSDNFKTYIPRTLAKRFFQSDDVMIGRYGPPVFQIFRGLSGSYNVALMKALPRGDMLKVFVYYLLQEPRLHAYVVARSERTAGQSGVNLELLENYPAYLPPLGLQYEFARRVAAVERLEAAQQSSLMEVDTLFASLQYRAFRGAL